MAGSASSIRITPTASEAVKDASAETKVSYGFLFLSIFLFIWGWRHGSYWAVKNTLKCQNNLCVLTMRSPGWEYKTVEGLRREHMIKTDMVRIDPKTKEVLPLTPDEYREKKKKKGKKKDKDQRYTYSYTLEYNHPETMERRTQVMNDFRAPSRSRARKQMTKLSSYIKGDRSTLELKESMDWTWQSILAIVFGVLCFLLTLLLGQFADPKAVYNKALVRKRHFSKVGAHKRRM
eukprot:CAMPEP_0196810178 /NCGR_PEP_ID=MMETSP1362-20130617/10009_1 /TAXON_ID=163516 /ORGANISM="Leptocylindrus danicus, Strain CCMP1856" /LENGTH=233 /DNA_ID=CAMNT_0042185071 /DNA_START=198 /DNA_END=899 /DNA_ORIENTATION=+